MPDFLCAQLRNGRRSYFIRHDTTAGSKWAAPLGTTHVLWRIPDDLSEASIDDVVGRYFEWLEYTTGATL